MHYRIRVTGFCVGHLLIEDANPPEVHDAVGSTSEAALQDKLARIKHSDYFRDGALHWAFETAEQARAQYIGPDDYGLGVAFEVLPEK